MRVFTIFKIPTYSKKGLKLIFGKNSKEIIESIIKLLKNE